MLNFIQNISLTLDDASLFDMRWLTAIALIQIFTIYIGEILTSNLYSKNLTTTTQEETLETITGVSKFQCLHRCKRHPQCEDIALGEDGVCFLLRVGSSSKEGSERKESLRMSLIKLPGIISYITFSIVICFVFLFSSTSYF